MNALTPAERRGALVIVLLLALASVRDLWCFAHPRFTRWIPSAADTSGPGPPATADGASAPDSAAPREAATAAAEPLRVDLNIASARDLDALPGIGPVLAARIVAHRQAHGPFRRPEELLAVRGIGPRLFERLRPHVRTGPPRARP